MVFDQGWAGEMITLLVEAKEAADAARAAGACALISATTVNAPASRNALTTSTRLPAHVKMTVDTNAEPIRLLTSNGISKVGHDVGVDERRCPVRAIGSDRQMVRRSVRGFHRAPHG